jgi:hypothetical protein
MSRYLFLMTAALLSLGLAPAPKPDGPPEKVRTLYTSLRGMYRPVDDKSPLSHFWLHAGEKASLPKAGKWEMRLVLAFDGKERERFDGKPANAGPDGDGMKFTLPAPGKGSKHTVRSLRIHKVGDKLHLQITGGPYEGKYVLKRVPSKS